MKISHFIKNLAEQSLKTNLSFHQIHLAKCTGISAQDFLLVAEQEKKYVKKGESSGGI